MLNKQKILAFIELCFIVFTTNANNLRKQNIQMDNYDLFFHMISLITCIFLIAIYLMCIYKHINMFDKNIKVTYLIVNFAILIFYLFKVKIYTDPFFIPMIFLIGFKSIIFCIYFLIVERKQ